MYDDVMCHGPYPDVNVILGCDISVDFAQYTANYQVLLRFYYNIAYSQSRSMKIVS